MRRDTLLLLGLQTFYKLSGVVLLMVLSRCLPSEDIGVYFFALSFAESFTILASLRLGPVLMRRVAAAPEQAAAQLSSLLGFRLVTSPLYLLGVSVAAIVFAGEIWRVIAVVAAFTLLENIYFSFGQLFLALRKIGYNVGIGLAVQAVYLAAFLLGMWSSASLNALLAADLLRSFLLVMAAVFVTYRWLGPLRLSWDSSFIREGTPFILLTLLTMLRGKLDTLLLGFFTDYSTVGQYHLALRVVLAGFFVPLAFEQALFPQLAAHGPSAANLRLLVRMGGGLFGLGLLGMGIVFLGAVPLTTLLYGAYASTVTPLLRPLTLLLPLSFLYLFLSTALQALHHEARALKASALGTGMNILANCALIPLFGAYGVIYARLLATLCQVGVLGWHLCRLFAQAHLRAPRRHAITELTRPTVDLK
jgi:PST family polysaccharide transporter